MRLNFFVASILTLAGLAWFVAIQRGGGWPGRTRRGATVLSIAVLGAGIIGCGAGHDPARERGRIVANSSHGLVFATSAAVSQARRAVATP